ncbi:Abi family protein [uncultured Bacteroides sp.]|uniref:Abi family protein n=1 Tax=uncultured Bacteroides sp. TaxID=162156 RepID=UPI003451D794
MSAGLKIPTQKIAPPRFKEEFVQEYFAKHDNPQFPSAWKTLEHVSFGTLSKLYWGNPNRCGNAESELY